MSLRHSLFLLITTFIMLTRAFTFVSKTAITRNHNTIIPKTTTLSTLSKPTKHVKHINRFMSTTDNSGDETTIVQTCTDKIKAALETDDVKVTGAYDDPNGSHISIEVKSVLFEGKRPVQRQQMVYKALWDELQGPVHAVDAMICKTPDE